MKPSSEDVIFRPRRSGDAARLPLAFFPFLSILVPLSSATPVPPPRLLAVRTSYDSGRRKSTGPATRPPVNASTRSSHHAPLQQVPHAVIPGAAHSAPQTDPIPGRLPTDRAPSWKPMLGYLCGVDQLTDPSAVVASASLQETLKP
jgi:hypothetical protein